MIASSLTQGVITAAVSLLYVSGGLGFSILILFVLLLYTGAQFYTAANSAIIPRIVSRENLGAANGLFTLTTSANQLVGYSVGGVIITAIGPSIPITYDSLTFFFAAGMLMLVAKSYGQVGGGTAAPGAQTGRRSFWKDFREGLAYVRQNRLFLQLVVSGFIINAFGGVVFARLAPYTTVQVHGDSSTYGFLLAAFLFGSIIGSVAVGKVNFRSYVGKFLFVGAAAFGVLLGLSGLASTGPEALGLFLAMGGVIAAVNIPIQALVQTQIPGELLGRASTVLRSLLSAAQPAAAAAAGSIATVTSISSLFFGSGIFVAAGSVLLFFIFAELRNAKY